MQRLVREYPIETIRLLPGSWRKLIDMTAQIRSVTPQASIPRLKNKPGR
jgi:hypothetical protein